MCVTPNGMLRKMKYINLEYHPHDSRIKISDDDVVQTLNQRMGTGGGNVPLIIVLEDEEKDSISDPRSVRSGHNISR